MAELKILEEKTEREEVSMDDALREILEDPRSPDGLKQCMQCATCVAGCPAARLYDDFNPRMMMRDIYEGKLEELLDGEGIWRCGQCFTCHARCPRGNSPANVVLILRRLAVLRGYAKDGKHNECAKLRDVAPLVACNLYGKGNNLSPYRVPLPLAEEFGPEVTAIWMNMGDLRKKVGYDPKETRKAALPEKTIKEVQKLLDLTGFKDFIEKDIGVKLEMA